jgi:hypothetical protein
LLSDTILFTVNIKRSLLREAEIIWWVFTSFATGAVRRHSRTKSHNSQKLVMSDEIKMRQTSVEQGKISEMPSPMSGILVIFKR